MRTITLLAAAALVAAPAAAGAQQQDDALDFDRPVRAQVGGNVYFARPVGEFADHINQGWGGNAHGTLLLGPSGAFGLRADVGFMSYGRERTRECLLTSCLILVDVTTSNNLAYVGAGPQIMSPVGIVRPYINGQIGWTWLWTQSEVEGSSSSSDPFASTTNFNDNTFSYGGAGGMLIPVAFGRTPVSIDLGARYLRNGRVEYLREGDIVVNPGAPPNFNIQRSRADLVTYYVGVSVGVR